MVKFECEKSILHVPEIDNHKIVSVDHNCTFMMISIKIYIFFYFGTYIKLLTFLQKVSKAKVAIKLIVLIVKYTIVQITSMKIMMKI